MDTDLEATLQLVGKAQGGDKEALDRLLARYYERVRRIVRLRLGARLRGRLDSGDILQETFIAAVDSFERFEARDEGSFINWLAKLAERQIYAAADHHGAQKRSTEREVPLDADLTGAPLEPAAVGPLPPELISVGEEVELVERCIQELPDEYRELIILRDYAGASWDTISAETGRPSADAARMMHAKALIELGRLTRRQRSSR